jgi:hypothetical protein
MGSVAGPMAMTLYARGNIRTVRVQQVLIHMLACCRLGPVEWAAPGSSFDQLRQQVEAASAKAGKRALLISFSLGGPYAATFLQQQVDQAWREQHVEALISLSGEALEAAAAAVACRPCRQQALQELLPACLLSPDGGAWSARCSCWAPGVGCTLGARHCGHWSTAACAWPLGAVCCVLPWVLPGSSTPVPLKLLLSLAALACRMAACCCSHAPAAGPPPAGFWGGTPTSLLAAVAGVWLGIQSVNQALLLQLLRWGSRLRPAGLYAASVPTVLRRQACA